MIMEIHLKEPNAFPPDDFYTFTYSFEEYRSPVQTFSSPRMEFMPQLMDVIAFTRALIGRDKRGDGSYVTYEDMYWLFENGTWVRLTHCDKSVEIYFENRNSEDRPIRVVIDGDEFYCTADGICEISKGIKVNLEIKFRKYCPEMVDWFSNDLIVLDTHTHRYTGCRFGRIMIDVLKEIKEGNAINVIYALPEHARKYSNVLILCHTSTDGDIDDEFEFYELVDRCIEMSNNDPSDKRIIIQNFPPQVDKDGNMKTLAQYNLGDLMGRYKDSSKVKSEIKKSLDDMLDNLGNILSRVTGMSNEESVKDFLRFNSEDHDDEPEETGDDFEGEQAMPLMLAMDPDYIGEKPTGSLGMVIGRFVPGEGGLKFDIVARGDENTPIEELIRSAGLDPEIFRPSIDGSFAINGKTGEASDISHKEIEDIIKRLGFIGGDDQDDDTKKN